MSFALTFDQGEALNFLRLRHHPTQRHLVDNRAMHETWNSIRSSAVWVNPIVSGFIAAVVVHLLTQSRERERWILDCKKQEFRELLSALSDAYSKTITMLSPQRPLDGDEHTRLQEAQSNSVRIIRDRIYIAKDIKP